MSTSYELRGVGMRYGVTDVLRGVTLQIEPARLVGTVGSSARAAATAT